MFHNVSKRAVLLCSLLAATGAAFAFCGFYVSRADGTLKNKTSQVIMVRDGNRSVITMYNDFHGKFSEFAMVVPVPVLLKKDDIKVVDQQIFKTLNEYSQPRLVEYFDHNPCQPEAMEDRAVSMAPVMSSMAKDGRRDGVRIEAHYLVGEYDILILGAKESSGLQRWLERNGYKVPKGAEEVLEPYIKSNLKFFVVKVNEAEKKKLPGDFLRPIQISFNSPKFMLPIRLGMANADGDQDLLVYAFSRSGRVECTNYRTASLPTGDQVPLFVQKDFSRFYAHTFERSWQREGRSVAMLEYAWDVSPRNYIKCDPCVAMAPASLDLAQAGVWWLTDNPYEASVYFTRLHVRYNRTDFPQDLMFQSTPNRENFQARYVITHPAEGDFDCAEGKAYKRSMRERRIRELRNLKHLTGDSYYDWVGLDNTLQPKGAEYAVLSRELPQQESDGHWALWGGLCVAAALGIYSARRES